MSFVDDAMKLRELRAANDGAAITVWQDGCWKLWQTLDAKYAEKDEGWLLTIPVDFEIVQHRAELAAVTRERDALKSALNLIAQHDGSDFAPAHRAIVKKARDTIAQLESGDLRKPAQKPAP